MELIKDYMRDDTLRHALNRLTQKTFCFDFEGWYNAVFFEGDYIPYSFYENGEIISNVSANRMMFCQNGVNKEYIQLGTVMTDEAFRKRGLAAQLMKHVIAEYENKCNGIYLFGNLDALSFYRKLGFREGLQYRYFMKGEFYTTGKKEGLFSPVDKSNQPMKQKYRDYVRSSALNSSFEQINKYSLQMFYTAGMDDVYYSNALDCFVVAAIEEDSLLLQSVICKERVSLADILSCFAESFHSCELAFVPASEDMKLCYCEPYDGADDYRMFYWGDELASIEEHKLYFPVLSHA